MQSNKNEDVDLDIKNYSTRDLYTFFKVSDNYTEEELNEREKQISLAILKAQGGKYTNEYKFAVLNFVKTVKDILKGLIGESLDENFNKRVIEQKLHDPIVVNPPNAQPNNVGRLINPFSNHPSLQYNSIPFNSPNGYNTSTTITNYVFNTLLRDEYFTSVSTNSTFSFPTIKNVISITLSAFQFPNTIYAFSDARRTTQIIIKDDTTGNAGLVTIPEGNYDIYTFPTVLEKAINEQILGVYIPEGPNIFTVRIEPNTDHTVISNSSGTFTLDTFTPLPKTLGENCADDYYGRLYKYDDSDPKRGVRTAEINQTLGYRMGYRLTEYSGSNSYTSEGCFDPVANDYVLFSLNEYSNVQYVKNSVAVLPSSTVSNNILGVIPIRTPAFTVSFDNGADFIFKTRNYMSPVDISRINIKVLDAIGRVLDINFSDFSFVLQFTCIFDNTIPFSF